MIQGQINLEYRNVDDVIPYEKNPRINDDAVAMVAKSIQEFGFKVPVIVDQDNILVAGHTRVKAAKLLGLESIPVIKADDLTPEKVKAFRLADNKVAEFADWDYGLLENELNEILNIDMSDFGFEDLEEQLEGEDESLYTDKIETPIYEITGEEPGLDELVENEKVNHLITKINSSDLAEDIKEFLVMAAYRHLKFNYAKIAEYYAHADSEVQELMEDSALVIIDFDKAIEEGYVTLSDEIEAMREEDE